MDAVHTPAPDLQVAPALKASGNERCCLATGETLAKDELVRFVIGPDHAVVPDLAHNLPGRGLWVKADAAAITAAITKGLFARAAKEKARTAPDLLEQVVRLLRARCLSLAGLAKGAGVAVLGETQVAAELKAGKLGLLLLAADASVALDNRQNIPISSLFTRDELGHAFGYAQIVYAGFKPHGLTKRLKSELYRLTKLLDTSLSTSGNG